MINVKTMKPAIPLLVPPCKSSYIPYVEYVRGSSSPQAEKNSQVGTVQCSYMLTTKKDDSVLDRKCLIVIPSYDNTAL